MPKKTTPKKKEAAPAPAVQKTTGMSKSDFVRSQPNPMPASEVIRRGKELGLTITESLVYNVRAADKKKTPLDAPQALNHASLASPGSDLLERQLRTCIARVGLDRAKKLFADFEQSLALEEPTVDRRKPGAGANVSRSSSKAATPTETKPTVPAS